MHRGGFGWRMAATNIIFLANLRRSPWQVRARVTRLTEELGRREKHDRLWFNLVEPGCSVGLSLRCAASPAARRAESPRPFGLTIRELSRDTGYGAAANQCRVWSSRASRAAPGAAETDGRSRLTHASLVVVARRLLAIVLAFLIVLIVVLLLQIVVLLGEVGHAAQELQVHTAARRQRGQGQSSAARELRAAGLLTSS